jgi:hypothetical protein
VRSGGRRRRLATVDDKLDALAASGPGCSETSKLPGARILDGQFSAVQQASRQRENTASATFLRDFVERRKPPLVTPYRTPQGSRPPHSRRGRNWPMALVIQTELAFLTIAEAARLIRKAASPVKLTTARSVAPGGHSVINAYLCCDRRARARSGPRGTRDLAGNYAGRTASRLG